MAARVRRARTAGAAGAAVLAAALLVVLATTGCTVQSADAAHGRRTPASRSKPTSTPTPTAPDAGAGADGPPAADGTPTAGGTPAAAPFDTTAESRDDPASIWVVVNKARGLAPPAYVPPDLVFPGVTYVNRQPLRRPAADALITMFAAGKAEAGLDFAVQSGYRSYDSQQRVYDDDVAKHGTAFADTDTARPGHSEHQTGLAVDISAVPAKCSLDACFAETPQGRWLAANAWRFGFLLRYPADKAAVTGFTFEPWHFRFVGVALTTRMHDTGSTTLEEFFGIPGGETYR